MIFPVSKPSSMCWVRFNPWGQGYKEKHKLDSKLISDSAFRTHLSFCKNREIINLSDLKLKTQTSNSGSWRCYAGGGKRNENRDSIKCGKRKGGKLDGPITDVE